MVHGIGVPRTHMIAAMASTSASSIPTTIPAMAPPDMLARLPLLSDVASTVLSTPTGVGDADCKTAGCSLVPVPSPLSPDESSLVGMVLPVSMGAAVVPAPPSDVAAAGDADGVAAAVAAAGAAEGAEV